MPKITLEVSDELANRLAPYQDILSEIIEMGLRQVEARARAEGAADRSHRRQRVLDALCTTGIVAVPEESVDTRPHSRRTPIEAGGKPASEIIIETRR